MPRIKVVLVTAVALLATAAPASSESTGPVAFAGASQRVDVDSLFTLRGTVEGAEGPVSVAWSAPERCSLGDPGALTTPVVCFEAGVHTFLFSVDAANGAARDDVAIAVVRDEDVVVASAEGDVAVGLPDEVTGDSGEIDGASADVLFEVPARASFLSTSLDWRDATNDFDLALTDPYGSSPSGSGQRPIGKPEKIAVSNPAAGSWRATIMPKRSAAEHWTFTAIATIAEGDASIPTLTIERTRARVGEPVTVTAVVEGGTEPYAVSWERDLDSYRFDDASGLEMTFEVAGFTLVKARVRDALGLTAVTATVINPVKPGASRPFTVVAVVDDEFSPYHYDFVGHQHPWNTDGDPKNDFDFSADPSTYIEGHPGATAIDLTIPLSDEESVGALSRADTKEWLRFEPSEDEVNLYWFPGTKVIGAVSFSPFRPALLGRNNSHGTRSAASAVGNIHGTCPECLVVLIQGLEPEALAWAASQPWIDVVTNSYGHSTTGFRDNIYSGAPVEETKAASDAGQVIVFSAGNGFLNSYDVPMFTYWSSEKGPDWMVTVGAVNSGSQQTYLGTGKPVDISSIGDSYPSTGGDSVAGSGSHGGTSNAAPVTAGTFAKVLQVAREALGDKSPGHADGVVATGTPVTCGAAWGECPLGDGTLTRRELQDLVFENVLPSPTVLQIGQQIPTTEYAYYYQGHGVLSGRIRGNAVYASEWGRMAAAARGDVAPYVRPPGEANWFIVDSKCRQKLWGTWSGGYYDGTEPTIDSADRISPAFNAFCTVLPEDALGPTAR